MSRAGVLLGCVVVSQALLVSFAAAASSLMAASAADSTTAADDSMSAAAAVPMMEDEAAAAMVCPAVHFAVPLFGGGATGPNGTLSISSYHGASDSAHSVLGLGVLCMIFAWAGFVLEVWRLRTASRISASCQISMGLYLFAWLGFLMHPSGSWEEMRALWAYASTDMLQLQHSAIAAGLCAGGIIELLQAQYLLPPMTALPLIEAANAALADPSAAAIPVDAPALRKTMSSGSYWHELWSINLIMMGLIFMLHPQHSYSATIKHLMLGASLVLGGPLLIRAKGVAWTSEMQALAAARSRPTFHIDWSMVAAGGCFAVGACILLAFRESALAGPHMGTTIECQPSLSLVVMGWVVAAASTMAAVVAGAKQWRSNGRKQRLQQGPAAAAAAAESSGGCMQALRSRILRRRGFGLLWGQDDGEQQAQQEDLVELELSTSSPSASPTAAQQRQQADADAEELAEWSAGNGHGHHDKREADAGHAATMNRELMSVYAPAATATAVTLRAPAAHHAAAAREDHDFDDAEQRRDRQRDRRREESYTGEDDGASAV